MAVCAKDGLVCIIEVRGDRDDDNGEGDLRFGRQVWSRLGSLNVGLVRARLARNASSKGSRTVACRCLTQRMRSGRCAPGLVVNVQTWFGRRREEQAGGRWR